MTAPNAVTLAALVGLVTGAVVAVLVALVVDLYRRADPPRDAEARKR